jgi:zinc D-Ala-D-Ala carboxypeptidase
MTYREPARRRSRRVGSAVLAALVVVSGVLLGVGSLGSATVDGDPASAAAPGPPGAGVDSDRRAPGPPAGAVGEPPVLREHARSLSEAGSVPDGGQSVFDDKPAAVANLDPALRGALRRAAADAAGNGVEIRVNSGWRSAQYQAQLLRDASAEYGSEEEAARWVATPETSAHVSGDAVDIAPSAAARWLSRHGSAYGLCQIYENEPWHYELRPDAVDNGCPAMYANPTHDPRMQQ